jgi:hypothetical protein
MHKDNLPIAEPCQVDFDAMLRGEKSRFCGACKKHVHELTKLTEAEARTLLATPSTEGLCVRYVHDELGHVVFRDSFRERPIPANALIRAKRVLQTALVALPLSLTACMGASQQRPALMGEPAPSFAPDASPPDPAVNPSGQDASTPLATSTSADAGAPKLPKAAGDEQSPKPSPLPLAR